MYYIINMEPVNSGTNPGKRPVFRAAWREEIPVPSLETGILWGFVSFKTLILMICGYFL